MLTLKKQLMKLMDFVVDDDYHDDNDSDRWQQL